MQHKPRFPARGALLCLTLLLAACGADDDSNDAVGAETSSPADNDPSLTDELPSGDTEGEGAERSGFSMNGFRYCEILATLDGDDGAAVIEVWGTPGVGPCEDAAWNALDPDAVIAQFGTSSIHMNGPRYFTVDGIVETAPAAAEADPEAEIRDVGGISMRLLATVADTGNESTAYQPELVVRTATMAFNAGTEVYELTDPDGNTYLMQSYALIQDPNLTATDLASLGDRLDLPDGWSYNVRILDANLQLALTPGGAVVVQDELQTSYQRNVIGS